MVLFIVTFSCITWVRRNLNLSFAKANMCTVHLYILFSVTDISAVVKALNNADRSSCHLEAGLNDSVVCGRATRL